MCKEVPTFIDDNRLDPESESYIVPAPLNLEFDYSFTSSKEIEYTISWANPSRIYTGSIIERFNPVTNQYSFLESPSKDVNTITYQVDTLFIEEQIRFLNFYINSKQESIYSFPSEKTAIQQITDFTVHVDNDNLAILNWNHSLINSSAEIIITKQIDDSDNIILAQLSISEVTFKDTETLDPTVFTTYSIYAVDQYFKTPSKSVRIGQDGVDPPNDLILEQINSTSLLFTITVNPAIEAIDFTIKSLVSDFEFTRSIDLEAETSLEILVNQIPRDEGPYLVEARSIQFGIASNPLVKTLQPTPRFGIPQRLFYNHVQPLTNDRFFVNNGDALAFLKIPENSENLVSPTVVDLNSRTISHSFKPDVELSNLAYSQSTGFLYANMLDGFWELDPVSGSEKMIDRPDDLTFDWPLEVNGKNGIAYLYNTSANIVLFDINSGSQISNLPTSNPMLVLSENEEYLFAYSYEEEYYDVYRTSDHSIIYSSTDKVDSLQIIPEIFFGEDEMLIWSKYYGLFRLDLTTLNYSYITHNPVYGGNNVSGFYNTEQRHFYIIAKLSNNEKELSVIDVETGSYLQKLDISNSFTNIQFSNSTIEYNYSKNVLMAISSLGYIFEFSNSIIWDLE